MKIQIAKHQHVEEAFIDKFLQLFRVSYEDLTHEAKVKAQRLANSSDTTVQTFMGDLAGIYAALRIKLNKRVMSSVIEDYVSITTEGWFVGFDLETNQIIKADRYDDYLCLRVVREQTGFTASVHISISADKTYELSMGKMPDVRGMKRAAKSAHSFTKRLIKT